jgi:hypothetical protein
MARPGNSAKKTVSKTTPVARSRSPKAPRPPREVVQSPQARRRRKSADVSVRKGATLSQVQPGHGSIPGVLERRSRFSLTGGTRS